MRMIILMIRMLMVLMIMMIFDEHSDFSGAENGAGLSWEHGQLHPGLFSHHEYDYG